MDRAMKGTKKTIYKSPVKSTLCEKECLGALRCAESHVINQCRIESPISSFWTDYLIVLYDP